MMMEFIFSEQKAKENNYDISKCYEIVDKFFAKYGIHPIAKGIYKEPETQNTFNAFGGAVGKFPKTTWFLKVIDEWYWREEGDEIENREDCLKTYYKVKERNQRKHYGEYNKKSS